MHASDGLLRLLLVDFVADFIAFSRNGQDARPSERFQWVSRLRMNHPHTKPQGIANIGEQQRGDEKLQDPHYQFLLRNGHRYALP